MRLQPGEILDGKYRIVRPIGEGGMGTVYEGENTRIRRRVAIKVLHAAVAEKQDVVQRFEREAQAAGRIGSEHIVEVLDLGNLHSGERYMVMEFLDGEDFTHRIKRLGRLTPEQVAPLLVQVLEDQRQLPFRVDHVVQPHNVRVPQLLQQGDFTDGCRRDPFVLGLQPDAFQGNNRLRNAVLGLVHHPVRAFTNLFYSSKVIKAIFKLKN
jgi:hypothetical protein